MADELAIKGKQVVSLVIEKGIPDVIRPLQREIYLFDTYIAGTTHLKDKSVIEAAAEGDRLILQREEKNKSADRKNQNDHTKRIFYADTNRNIPGGFLAETKAAAYTPRPEFQLKYY